MCGLQRRVRGVQHTGLSRCQACDGLDAVAQERRLGRRRASLPLFVQGTRGRQFGMIFFSGSLRIFSLLSAKKNLKLSNKFLK